MSQSGSHLPDQPIMKYVHPTDCALGSGSLLEPDQALLVEPLAPLGDDLAGSAQPGGDLVVGHPLGGQQHDLGSCHVAVRRGIAPDARLEPIALVFGQFDVVRAGSRHGSLLPRGQA